LVSLKAEGIDMSSAEEMSIPRRLRSPTSLA
jgi:hypothetical protein